MSYHFKSLLTVTCMVLVFLSTAVHASEAFKSSEVLSWTENSRISFFQTSITTAAFIAGQNNSKQVSCINDWYFQDSTARNNELEQTLQRFPNNHPTGVILAVLKKACGDFKYSG